MQTVHSVMNAMMKDRSNFYPCYKLVDRVPFLLERYLVTVIHINLSIHHSISPVHLTPQVTAQVPSTENNDLFSGVKGNCVNVRTKYGRSITGNTASSTCNFYCLNILRKYSGLESLHCNYRQATL